MRYGEIVQNSVYQKQQMRMMRKHYELDTFHMSLDMLSKARMGVQNFVGASPIFRAYSIALRT